MQLREHADSLQTLPERGRVVAELRQIGVLAYQKIVHKPWRIVYTVQGREVWITAALDGHRDLTDLLFERLIR